MGQFTSDEIMCYGWKGVRFSAGNVSLTAAPSIGGRIVSFTIDDEELFFVQEQHKGETFDFSKVDALRAEKRKLGFRLWGGDKTWIAPQKDWWESRPPLELDAGQYECQSLDRGVTMVSPACRETGLRITRQIKVDDDGTIRLSQEIHNKSDKTVRKGIWNVTQLLRPFDIYVPATTAKIRSYHVEDLTLPSHSIMVTHNRGWSGIPCRDNTLFKFGVMPDTGCALAVRECEDHVIAFLRVFEIAPRGAYAHRSVVEVFNSCDHDYLEVEVHSPIASLLPGDSTRHDQIWRVRRFLGRPPIQEIFEELSAGLS